MWLHRILETLWLRFRMAWTHTESKIRLDYAVIKDIIKVELGVVANMPDRYLYVYDLATMKNIVSMSLVKFRSRIKDEHDCDDFARSFMSLYRDLFPNIAIGIVWTKTHALNCFIDDDMNVWLVEPQSNRIFKHDKDDKVRKVILG